jgi:hypothetical protein
MAFVLKRAALLDKEGKSGIAAWDCKGAKDQEAGHLRLVLNAESSDEAPADDGLHDLDWLHTVPGSAHATAGMQIDANEPKTTTPNAIKPDRSVPSMSPPNVRHQYDTLPPEGESLHAKKQAGYESLSKLIPGVYSPRTQAIVDEAYKQACQAEAELQHLTMCTPNSLEQVAERQGHNAAGSHSPPRTPERHSTAFCSPLTSPPTHIHGNSPLHLELSEEHEASTQEAVQELSRHLLDVEGQLEEVEDADLLAEIAALLLETREQTNAGSSDASTACNAAAAAAATAGGTGELQQGRQREEDREQMLAEIGELASSGIISDATAEGMKVRVRRGESIKGEKEDEECKEGEHNSHGDKDGDNADREQPKEPTPASPALAVKCAISYDDNQLDCPLSALKV